MASRTNYTWPTLATIIGICIFVVALPQQYKGWAPSFLQSPSLHFGLDLAGGTQLDFRISEKEIEEQIESIEKEIAELEARGIGGEKLIILQNQLHSINQQKLNLVEAIRTVLERRINALGVSEAVITPSYIGEEKHLLVECPGVVDTQECIATVGKTIHLEFKEEHTEQSDEYDGIIRAKVADAQVRLKEEGMTLEKLGQDLESDLAVSYQTESHYFLDELPDGLEAIWNKTPTSGVQKIEATVQVRGQDSAGQDAVQDVPGVFLAEVLQARTQTGRVINEASRAFELLAGQDRTLTHTSIDDKELDDSVAEGVQTTISSMQPGQLRTAKVNDNTTAIIFLRRLTPGQVQMAASHILIAYEGAASAGADVTRTKEEAQQKAAELKSQADAGSSFENLAAVHSDGPSGKAGGSLGVFGIGTMVPAFEAAVQNLKLGEISEIVETQFGYHIIRSDQVPTLTKDTARYEQLTVKGENSADRAAELIGQLQRGEVVSQEDQIVVRSLFFSLLPTGWKDTLLDGKHFRAATVTLDPTTNIPIVQISFDDEGGRIFQELTKNNVNKRIAIFVGGQLVSAPTVQQEISGGTAVITGSNSFEEANRLAQDLNTGAIPAPIHLSGQRTVEATLGAAALETSLKAALLGIIILMGYMIVMYRFLGLLADIALSAYAMLFFAFLKLPLFLFTSNHIVLTLAGMAGIILSIGMAVDANVLIFERMKEELKKGKMLRTAAETGFARAWPSIRDGNVSTLITCAILFLIGTSIVRGFAVTLCTGVLLSMFSAIVITRWLIKKVATTKLAEKTWLFG